MCHIKPRKEEGGEPVRWNYKGVEELAAAAAASLDLRSFLNILPEGDLGIA